MTKICCITEREVRGRKRRWSWAHADGSPCCLPDHSCILSVYLGDGAQVPWLPDTLQQILKTDKEGSVTAFQRAIHALDFGLGNDQDIQVIRSLAERLGVELQEFHWSPLFGARPVASRVQKETV